jgi:ABC-2 type transport system permease protein
MQALAAFSPATYILDGVRQALIDGAPITSMLGYLAILAVMACVFIPLGIFVFGWAERYAKRTGKLKRVG